MRLRTTQRGSLLTDSSILLDTLRIAFVITAIVLLSSAANIKPSALTLTVTKTADTNDGVCDSDCSLREAITAANAAPSDDTVVFDATVFNSVASITLSGGQLEILNSGSLTINGPGRNLLTISGNGQSRVLLVSIGAVATVSNLTVTGGRTQGSDGGGIYSAGALSINNLLITGNSSGTDNGGGVYSNAPNQVLTIASSTIENNTGNGAGVTVFRGTAIINDSLINGNIGSSGGGILASEATLSLNNVTVSNNIANIGGLGGGIYNARGSITATDSTISGNRAKSSGAGIYNDSSSLTLTRSVIIGNSTTEAEGGGICSRDGLLNLVDVSIIGNFAGFNGGGIWHWGLTAKAELNNVIISENTGTTGGGIFLVLAASMNINNSVVNDNVSTSGGGGIHADSGKLNVSNSTLANNRTTAITSGGAGIQVGVATIDINSSTIANNHTGSGGGGGIRNRSGTDTGTVKLLNTIVADNGSAGTDAADIFGEITSRGHNLIENRKGGSIIGVVEGNITERDPQLVPLRTNGGATQTIALQPTSPAIDSGDPNAFPTTDQRGIARAQDGDLDGSSLPDIGAYERQVTKFTVSKATDSNDGTCDSDCSLREALAASNSAAQSDVAVVFDVAVFRLAEIIPLSLGSLQVTRSTGTLLINGTGRNLLTISGENQTRILQTSPNSWLTLRALTLDRGNSSNFGGAVYNGGNLVVFDSDVTNSTSSSGGGGIYNDRGSVTISGSKFDNDSNGIYNNEGIISVTGSTITNSRGPIQSSRGQLFISESTISNNTGGVANNAGTAQIWESVISHNSISGFNSDGAGITNFSDGSFGPASMTIVNSIISDNTASDDAGGIINIDGNMSIVNSAIENNRAIDGEGGGIRQFSGTMNIVDSTISGNQALIAGGGVSIRIGAMITFTNSTISGNTSKLGGGIYNDDGTLMMTSSTVAANTATNGGGIATTTSTYASVRLRNTLVAGNTASNSAPDFLGRLTSDGYNFIGNASGTTITGTTTGNIVNRNPRLGPLAKNSGSTLTHSLLPSSPAIDSGDPLLSPLTDQRGFTRPKDGDGNGSARADIGAFEVRTIAVTSTSDSGPGSLRQTISDVVSAGDSLVFDAALFRNPQTIMLTSGELVVPNDSVFTINGPGADKVAISGNNQSRVMFIGDGANVAVGGVTITGGNGSGVPNNGSGGAIYSAARYLTLLDSVVTKNSAEYGGGIYSVDRDEDGIIRSINSRITENSATNSGGGVFALGGTNEFTDSVFSHNSAELGGGVYCGPQQLVIASSDISDNAGGGLHIESGSTVGVLDSSVSMNKLRSGIYNSGNITVDRSQVSNNASLIPGGGIFNDSGASLSVNNSTISRNSSSVKGGGIFNADSTLSTVMIDYSTIVFNAAGIGGGVFNSANSTVNAGNTIIANNAATIQSPDFERVLTSKGYNLVKDATGTTIEGTLTGNVLGRDPLLDPILRLNGSSTLNHALRLGSPAIDRGCLTASIGATDQRGFTRPVDFAGTPNAQGCNGSDIGAFERQNSDLVVQNQFDFDADGRSDLAVRRPSDNVWYFLRTTAGYTGLEYGIAGDLMAPADYDGDGKTDVAVFRPSEGKWYIAGSSVGFYSDGWGQDGDLPVPADYDGDGKADVAVYRPSTGTWYRKMSSSGISIVQFGTAEDKPVPGDYDGDGKADLAVLRPSTYVWYFLRTTAGFTGIQWGAAGDIQAPADYDGDGKTDAAVFRPSTGVWFIAASTAGFMTQNWGANGDVPVPADYDGDGKADIAVYRPSNATWYLFRSSTGILQIPFGTTEDKPVQSSFIF